MKKLMKSWRGIAAIIALLAGLTGMHVREAAAEIVSPRSSVLGMTYGDWSAAWWQWALGFTNSTSPILDTSGEKCASGQSDSPVFFLAGAATTDAVTRNCSIPAGKTLVFPIINVECSTVEPYPFHGSTGQELRNCAGAWANGINPLTLVLTLDGKKVNNLHLHRVQSPVFDFVIPEKDNFLGVAKVTSGSSLSDGYWAIVDPLTPGQHTIHFEGAITSGVGAGWAQNLTYILNVE